MPKIIGIKPRRHEFHNLERHIMPNVDETTKKRIEEAASPEDQPRELTIDSIGAFFIEQRNLIEAQLKAEDAYAHCPVCSRTREFLRALGRLLESALQDLDKTREILEDASLNENSTGRAITLARLKRDLEWYDIARTALANLLHAGHNTKDVMSVHPELAVSKTQKRQFRLGKHRKQIAKESRRKNRH
jgi:hypothetical protein